jgi:hypothetical protein
MSRSKNMAKVAGTKVKSKNTGKIGVITKAEYVPPVGWLYSVQWPGARYEVGYSEKEARAEWSVVGPLRVVR